MPSSYTPKSDTSHRLTALDGLRGISALLVVVAHLDFVRYITFPNKLSEVLSLTLLDAGTASVGFFFVLCGFLMAYLYPYVIHPFAFIQKRYSRIFPVFVVMATFMSVWYFHKHISWELQLALLLSLAISTYFVWTRILKRDSSGRLVRTLFICFLTLQAVMIVINIFFSRVDSVIFSSLPLHLDDYIVALSNITLTFTFGKDIPMVDGVYWTLVAEVMFYILFPLIICQTLAYLRGRSLALRVLTVVASGLFLMGLEEIFKYILSMKTLHVHYAFALVIGIVVAEMYRNKGTLWVTIERIYSSRFIAVAMIVLYFLILLCWNFHWYTLTSIVRTPDLTAWMQLICTPFLGLVVIGCLTQRSYLRSIFSWKPLLYLGTISYSLYLCHTAVIHALQPMFNFSQTQEVIVYAVVALAISTALASILYYFLERPYFLPNQSPKISLNSPSYYNHTFARIDMRYVIGVIVSIFILMLIAFQQDFGLFSLSHRHKSPLTEQQDEKISLFLNKKISGEFTATEDRIGVIVIPVEYKGPPVRNNVEAEAQKAKYIFRIKEKGNKDWLSETTYMAWKMGDMHAYSFGFPEVINSKNKQFVFEFTGVDLNKRTDVIFENPNQSFISVYRVNKSEIFKHPLFIMQILINKLLLSLSHASMVYVVLLMIPALLTIILAKIEERKGQKTGTVIT